MSLIKNIGVGKEAYYNPFTISADDVQAWYDEALKRDIFPQELDGMPCKWELSRFSTPVLLQLMIDWNGRYVAIQVYPSYKKIFINSKIVGMALSIYMKSCYSKVDISIGSTSVVIVYESRK